jgi:predicted NUDIX family NTP pyrophosphohydrolase
VDDVPLGNFLSNQFEIEWPPSSGQRQSFPEIDKAEWVPLTEARERLVKAQGEFLDRLLAARFSR